MSDLISRKQAVDALRDYLVEKRCPNDGTLTCRLIENEVVNKLPSAQLDTYWKEQCQSYEKTINKLRESLSTQPEIIYCKDCDWWTKQEDSPQGRCALMGMYPTGGWFCGNARRRIDERPNQQTSGD